MTWYEKAADLSLVVQAILIFVSLTFIWFQLRQNAEIAKAANAQTLVDHAMAFTALLVQSPELARLWNNHGLTDQNDPNNDRYRELLIQWLIFHENIYYQYEKRLLDESVYRSWSIDLENVLKHHKLSIISSDIEAFFPGSFGRHVVALQARLEHSTVSSKALNQSAEKKPN